jgi:LacI family transcriptional regulator, galactose operon repressor
MADISDTASAPREASPGAGAATVRVGLGAALGSGPGTIAPPTIYDVARVAGVSIASVSRVLNGRNNPREETRERVLQAVAELGFAPDGAARALSARLKEVVGVIVRRSPPTEVSQGLFADEDESLQFPDMINRGIEVVAQLHGFDLLIRSVDVNDHRCGDRILSLARKSDGLILHDRLIEPRQLDRLARQIPIVTLAGEPTETTANVRGDNTSGMRELARHLVIDHGYGTVSYLGGHVDSPDNLSRHETLADEVTRCGAEFVDGPAWQGNYLAIGGARVIERLLASRAALPRAIACANDQTALGVLYTLAAHGVDVPGQVAVTGFDDIPVARHLRPQLTTVRQPIQDLGATAFEVLHSMISSGPPAVRDFVLPTRMVRRESCGCPPEAARPARLTYGLLADGRTGDGQADGARAADGRNGA